MASPDAAQPVGGPSRPALGPITVEVIHCPNRHDVDREQLVMPAGSTVADALRLSAVPARHPELGEAADGAGVGIHGRLVARDTVLRDGDRIELYRPLTVAPMEARRARQRAQKAAQAPRRGSSPPLPETVSGSRSR